MGIERWVGRLEIASVYVGTLLPVLAIIFALSGSP